MVQLLFLHSGGIVMLLFSLIISNCEDRVLFVLIHLTGVLCHLFKFFSSYQVMHLFSTGVLPNLFFLVPCLSRFNQCGFNSFLSIVLVIHSFATPRFTWCSLFLFSIGVLPISFNSVVFFLSTFQPLKVLWFHSLVEEATCFTSSLPLSFLSSAILDLGTRCFVVVECCNAARPTLQKTSSYSEFHRVICFVCCIICIASCHHVIFFKTQLNKSYGFFFDPFKSREFTHDFSL